MDDHGNDIFSLFIKRSKYSKNVEKKLSPMMPDVSQVAQDQSEEDRYMLASFYARR